MPMTQQQKYIMESLQTLILNNMNHILNMFVLGIISGSIAIFWTRLIRKNMIFRRFGKYLEILNNRHLIEHASDSMIVKFIQCCFCLSVWLVLLVELFYILEFSPWWLYCVIGTLGGLGAGNLVSELVCAIRNEAE
jgi:hypothetical protein